MRSYLACFDAYLRAPAGSEQEANAAELKRLAFENLLAERLHDRLDGRVLALLRDRPLTGDQLHRRIRDQPPARVGESLRRLRRRGLVVRDDRARPRWEATWEGLAA